MLEPVGYIASFCAGLILGLTGAGGSILTIPILVYLFSLDVIVATSYSLFIVGITSLVGSAQRHSSMLVDIRAGITFGIPAIITVFITRMWFMPRVPEIIVFGEGFEISRRVLILGLFSLLIICASFFMISKRTFKPQEGKPRKRALFLQGVLIGFLTGFLGVGGGFLIVPTLYFLAKIPIHKAIGTTLLIIAMKSLIGFLGDIPNFQMDWFFLISLSLISITGILLSSRFSKKIPAASLRRAFGWFTLVLGVAILLKESAF